MLKRSLVAVGVATFLSIGLSTSFLGMPGVLRGLPYPPTGMAQAEAKPQKPCTPDNDGEYVLDIEGLWRCKGSERDWKFIDPILPQPPRGLDPARP